MFDTSFTYHPSGVNQPTPDDLFQKDHLYSFNCPHNHQYIVHIEEYEHQLFMLKFHLKSHSNSKYKYQLATNIDDLSRVTGIIRTCLNIIQHEFLGQDENASFGFIGASSRNKLNDNKRSNTQRFRIYALLMKRIIPITHYQHYPFEAHSAYLMLSNMALTKNKQLLPYIKRLFHQIFEPDRH